MPKVSMMKRLGALASLALSSCGGREEVPVTQKEVVGCYGVASKTILRIDSQGEAYLDGSYQALEESFDEPSQMLTLSHGVQYDAEKERLFIFRNQETSYLITRLGNDVVIPVFKGKLSQARLTRKPC